MKTPSVPTGDPGASSEPRDRVKACIRDSGIPQREFARKIELDETKLSKALHGVRHFSSGELLRIATVSGVTVNWLLTGQDSAPGASATPAAQSLPQKPIEPPERGRRRREIVEASWHLFAERGYHAVRIADIAQACNISSPSIHYYFAAKQEILEEALRYSVKLAFDRQIASLHAFSDPIERLKELINLQLPTGAGASEWAIWLQIWAEITSGNGSHDNHAQAYKRWQQTVLDVVEEILRNQGQPNTTPDPPTAASRALELTSLADGLGIKVLTGLTTADEMRECLHSYIDRNFHTQSD